MTLLTEPTRIVLAKGQPVPNDPSFAFNSLLLHGDGANGSTVITDSSGSPKTVTAVGNAQISTAVADPFGNSTGVLAFDGNGDFLSAVASPSFAFSTGDFTVEAWVYPTAYPNTYHTISATRGIIGTANGWSWNVQNNGTMVVYSNVFTYQGTVTGAVPLNAWTHVAFVRSSGNIQIYAGGSANKTGSIANLANFTIESLWVGTTGGIATGGGDPFTGYINDLRITKGVARYTATSPHPPRRSRTSSYDSLIYWH
jgi:hypothetical protein